MNPCPYNVQGRYGDSGMGKSMIVETFRDGHALAFDSCSGTAATRLLVVEMAGRPGERRLYAQILAALGAPHSPRATIVDLEQNTLRLLRAVWEHRLARRRVRERHLAEVNEGSLFAAVEELRTIEREAVRLTRSARRNRARRAGSPAAAHLGGVTDGSAPGIPVPTTSGSLGAPGATPQPFDDIEDW